MAYSGTSEIDVEASQQELFDIVTDLDAFPEWLKDVREVEILGHDKAGLPTASRMRVDVSIREVEYVLEYTYDAPNRVSWTTRPGGDVKSINGSYTFEVNDDGSTRVIYELEMEPGFPVPGFLIKRATKHITSAALSGLKARAEGA
ncbi:MAG: SRPBCC family protein [Thermoleophilia bacterium]|nr:SRPBCC family protein [Thermoleophilia bacterium]